MNTTAHGMRMDEDDDWQTVESKKRPKQDGLRVGTIYYRQKRYKSRTAYRSAVNPQGRPQDKMRRAMSRKANTTGLAPSYVTLKCELVPLTPCRVKDMYYDGERMRTAKEVDAARSVLREGMFYLQGPSGDPAQTLQRVTALLTMHFGELPTPDDRRRAARAVIAMINTLGIHNAKDVRGSAEELSVQVPPDAAIYMPQEATAKPYRLARNTLDALRRLLCNVYGRNIDEAERGPLQLVAFPNTNAPVTDDHRALSVAAWENLTQMCASAATRSEEKMHAMDARLRELAEALIVYAPTDALLRWAWWHGVMLPSYETCTLGGRFVKISWWIRICSANVEAHFNAGCPRYASMLQPLVDPVLSAMDDLRALAIA